MNAEKRAEHNYICYITHTNTHIYSACCEIDFKSLFYAACLQLRSMRENQFHRHTGDALLHSRRTKPPSHLIYTRIALKIDAIAYIYIVLWFKDIHMYIHTEISSLLAHQISLSGGVDKSLLAHNPAHSTIHVDAERRAQLLAHVFCPDGPLCAHMKRVSSRAIRTAVIAYFMCGARPECSRSECTRARSYLRLREYALHLVCCARIYLSASYDLYIYIYIWCLRQMKKVCNRERS